MILLSPLSLAAGIPEFRLDSSFVGSGTRTQHAMKVCDVGQLLGQREKFISGVRRLDGRHRLPK
jgi:hypothetical protein